MSNKLGQEPAYPCEVEYVGLQIQQEHQVGNSLALNNGMSKRFYAACTAMQGGVGLWINGDIDNYDVENLISNCYKLADELLKQENG